MYILRAIVFIFLLFPFRGHSQAKTSKNQKSLNISQNLKISSARIEQLENPIGLDISQPRFSWILQSDTKDVMQTAYEITVTSAPDFNIKSLLWSSKKSSDQSIYIKYEGPALASNTRYYWNVKVWDNKGNIGMSANQYFHTGFMNASDWTAKWIAAQSKIGDDKSFPSPMFRKEFSVPKDVKSAMLFITSKGMYEAQLNGQRVGNDYLTPGWTSYKNRTQYQAYDVSNLVKKGQNAIGATLGKGWYKGYIGWVSQSDLYGKELGLIAQLIVTLMDGTKQIIQTDDTWTYGYGSIQDSEIYHGETIDGRKNVVGWSTSGFNPMGWEKVKLLNDGTRHLIGTYNQTVKKKEVVKPVKLIITPKNDTVLDFGQNMVGWVKLKVSGRAGTTVTILHAEVLDKDGNFYIENLRSAKQANVYTLAGNGVETFEPHFTFQGFRFIKVSGYPGTIDLNNFEGQALYSDIDLVGSFDCSNKLINQLQQNIQWGQRGNFVDVPTDCPQRDERLGWTGDAQAFSRTAAYNFNVQNFFAKWLQDLSADQNSDGGIPHVIPNALGKKDAASTGWADAGTIIPWNMYTIYGDVSFLERQYPSMKKWVHYMIDSSFNDLWNRGFHFGDWLFYSVNDDRDGKSAVTDKYLIAQCFFANSAQIVADAARVLGKGDEAIYYTELVEKVKTAFRREYVSANGRMVSGTQTAYVLALQFDMLLDSQRSYVAKLLVDNIKAYNYHITTGFLGTPYICHVLSRFGYADIAYKLLLQETYPSWLYPVKMGATTIWERWDGIKPDGSFQSASMNSFNHYAYGAIGDWMYRSVAGIEIDQIGYKRSIIKPILTSDLSYALSGTLTPYGPIKSGWYKNDGAIEFSVEIPVNTTSTVILPVSNISNLHLDGTLFTNSSYSKKAVLNQNEVKITLGSGKFVFSYKN